MSESPPKALDHEGFFIVGAPRSGTTLMQSILSAHSKIFSGPETSFFSRIVPLLGAAYSHPEQRVTEDDIVRIASDFEYMTGIGANFRSVVQPGATIRETFEALLRLFNPDDKPCWVEKTPIHAMHMMAIRRFYPTAKYIHVIRDPVDSVTSMIHLKPTSLTDTRILYLSAVRAHAALWKSCVSAPLRFPDQDKVLHLHFEDLVRNPGNTVKRLCGFLGFRFEPAMLQSFHQAADHLFSADYTPWLKVNLDPGLNQGAVHKWRGRLSPYTIWLIQFYTNDLARFLGYYQEAKARSKFVKLFYYIFDQILWLIAQSGLERRIRALAGGCGR
ncbi:MAG: sulfotransferase [Gemmatimonadetes bacterium]|nr:sulfotransferase [Gemmatimonadota bacterium]